MQYEYTYKNHCYPTYPLYLQTQHNLGFIKTILHHECMLWNHHSPTFHHSVLKTLVLLFRDQEVLKDVIWEVQTGGRIGLIGHNGAGKTT
jgi:ABC-type polysaccharide/polyol phosphate transport system ATPase subunit